MMYSQTIHSRCVLILLGVFIPACSTDNLTRDIARERNAIADETASVSTQKRNERKFTWNQAIARQTAHDTSLRMARERLEDVRRERKNQWREWLPRPTLYVSFQNAFENLGDLNSDDLRGALIAPLTIPNPWTQKARAYQIALTEVQAEAAYELTRRRQTITLYYLFSEWERSTQDKWENSSTTSIEEVIRARLQEEEQSLMNQERRQSQQAQFSRLLNLPGIDVTPVAETRPNIDYASKYRRFIPGRNYGLLATRLYAYEIQGSLLRKKGIQLSRWPTPTFSTNTPSIYDTTRQDEQFLGGLDEISLFGNWGKSFDVTGKLANEIRNAEENVGFTRENISVRIDSEGREWDRLKKRYNYLLKQREIVRNRLKKLTGNRPRISSVQEDILDARKLVSDLQTIERRKESLDLQLWLWDDSAW